MRFHLEKFVLQQLFFLILLFKFLNILKSLLNGQLINKISKMSRKQTPSEFLKQIIGRPVVVKLNSGVDYRGFLNYKLSKKKHCKYQNLYFIRCPSMFRWLYEYCIGTNRRVC